MDYNQLIKKALDTGELTPGEENDLIMQTPRWKRWYSRNLGFPTLASTIPKAEPQKVETEDDLYHTVEGPFRKVMLVDDQIFIRTVDRLTVYNGPATHLWFKKKELSDG